MGVKGGGCSGFSYVLDLTETQKETDELSKQRLATLEKEEVDSFKDA